ncbi:radical SAM protein [Clostridium sulfidigenes]|uniref:radical SAM protein n=1 Tax=Clostridium sulfidigenes TaxID=318464 RepID=UPI003F8BC353
MKFSNYNLKVKHNGNFIIFNTISKKYVFYDKEKHELIGSITNNLNKSNYSIEELNIIKKLWKIGGIIDNSTDEKEKAIYNENVMKYQNEVFFLTIQPTLDCNFRCVYCYEDHKSEYMSEFTENGIISYINDISQKVKKVFIVWFGGEPLLATDTINRISQEAIKICYDNRCKYESMIVTNGYLISEDNISLLERNRITTAQITLDGTRSYHNEKRPLLNGDKTFDKILDNIILLLKNNVKLILRINIDKNNISNISEVFDLIDPQYRKNIVINMCNLFQNNKSMNLYNLYLDALRKGYTIEPFPNKNYRCDGYSKNSLTIQPNGNIVPCSILAEKGISFGKINENGNLKIENNSMYYKFKNYVVTNQSRCRECITEPLCGGPCMYKNIIKGDVCDSKFLDGLTLEEKIKLKFEKDLLNNRMEEFAL